MKKLFILLALIPFFISVIAQERVVNKTGPTNALTELKTMFVYTGVAADVLTPTTTDTIDLVFEYRGTKLIKKITVKSRFDVVLGADTTVSISVFGKEFADDPDYVQVIPATLSAEVLANNTVKVLSSDPYGTNAAFDATLKQIVAANNDTISYPVQTFTPFDKTYRFYRVRYIISGDDKVGTGVKLDEVEFKIYTE